MTVSVTSFGFKYGLPLEADLVFDVRFMPNPFYIEDLRPGPAWTRRWRTMCSASSRPRTSCAAGGPAGLLPAPVRGGGKDLLVIAVGCTGGHHRSVAVTHALAEFHPGPGLSGDGEPPGHDPGRLRAPWETGRLTASPGAHGPRVVVIGGGHGLSNMLRGLKQYTENLRHRHGGG